MTKKVKKPTNSAKIDTKFKKCQVKMNQYQLKHTLRVKIKLILNNEKKILQVLSPHYKLYLYSCINVFLKLQLTLSL